jgi:parvulin-like peptidyl-prolyl isomerase
MLQAMRQNTKVILWITVVAFVLLIFLVWGADLQTGTGPGPGSIGSVNGQDIPISTYQTIYQQNTRFASAQGRDLQPSDILLIEEQTWNSIVEDILLTQEAEKRGLSATDSEVRQIMLNNPPAVVRQGFVNENGQFDMAAYQRVIRDPNTPESYLLQIEGFVRGTLPLQKLQDLVVSTAKVTDGEVRQEWLRRNEQARISYVMVDAAGREADATEDEVAAHYEETREQWETGRRADLRYITVPRRATAADTATIVSDLEEFRTEALSARTDEDARYSDFETLVMTFSDGPNAATGGLSSGYLASAEMTPAMRDAVEGLAPGEITEPFRDGSFFHIVEVVDAKEDSLRIRDLAVRIVPSDSTLYAVREELDAFREDAADRGLEAAATAAGYNVLTAEGLTEGGFVPGLITLPTASGFAFQARPGEVSRVFETNDGFYVLELAARHEAGVQALDEVQTQVRGDLLREKRLEAARADADQLTGAVKMGQSLEDAAAEAGLTVNEPPALTRADGIPGLGLEAEVLATAFALQPGQVSAPIKTTRGWVVLRVEERPPVDEEQFAAEAPQIRRTLLGQKQNEIYSAWMQQLKRDAKIQDFRI